MRHFLEEYETHGTFRGCCSVGFRWQDVENTHLRESLRVKPSEFQMCIRATSSARDLTTQVCAGVRQAHLSVQPGVQKQVPGTLRDRGT